MQYLQKPGRNTRSPIYQCAHHASRTQQINALKRMERDGKKYGINTFLMRSLTKGIHAWMHSKTLPEISQKTHPVHKLVQEAYDDQTTIGWRHAIRGRISKKWSAAQKLHNESRGTERRQGNIIIWLIWTAMDSLWKERNNMEHGTTEEERTLHAVARMNLRIKVAYSKKV